MNQGNTTTHYTDVDASEDLGSAFSMRAAVGYYLPVSKRMDLCGTAIIDHYFGLPLRALEGGGSWKPSLNVGLRYRFGH